MNNKVMRVLICGSRTFDENERVYPNPIGVPMWRWLDNELLETLSMYQRNGYEIEIVSGAAKGADSYGAKFAKRYSFKLTEFPAQWRTYGKSAGYKRNMEMIEYCDKANSSIVVAIWDGESKGTLHTIHLAKQHDLGLAIFKYDTNEIKWLPADKVN